MNKAIDQVRAAQVKQLRQDGYEPILKGCCWLLLKRSEILTDKQAIKLKQIVHYNLKSMRSKNEPMKNVARMLRSTKKLILNWFRAGGALSSGMVEGVNNKLKLITGL